MSKEYDPRVETYYTVAEAALWLVGCEKLVSVDILKELGRDCSMLSRVRQQEWMLRPTPHMPWPHERAYAADIIRDVFLTHPYTQKFVPKSCSDS